MTGDKCCSQFSNSTTVTTKFQNPMKKFDKLYAKRAFVHWFAGEGISEGFFELARLIIYYSFYNLNLLFLFINKIKTQRIN